MYTRPPPRGGARGADTMEAVRLEWTNMQPRAIQPWPWARERVGEPTEFLETLRVDVVELAR